MKPKTKVKNKKNQTKPTNFNIVISIPFNFFDVVVSPKVCGE